MKNTLAKCIEDAYLPSLHLPTVEFPCKLQEKLHRVTWPYIHTGQAKILPDHGGKAKFSLAAVDIIPVTF